MDEGEEVMAALAATQGGIGEDDTQSDALVAAVTELEVCRSRS